MPSASSGSPRGPRLRAPQHVTAGRRRARAGDPLDARGQQDHHRPRRAPSHAVASGASVGPGRRLPHRVRGRRCLHGSGSDLADADAQAFGRTADRRRGTAGGTARGGSVKHRELCSRYLNCTVRVARDGCWVCGSARVPRRRQMFRIRNLILLWLARKAWNIAFAAWRRRAARSA